jgi:hypothetical protein
MQQMSIIVEDLPRRNGERITLDRYYTPDLLARAIVHAVNGVQPITGTVLEPSAGAGSFACATLDLTEAGVMVCDLDPEAPCMNSRLWGARRARGRWPAAFLCEQDFLTVNHLTPSWVIGNPPYLDAEAHTRHALSVSRRVVFLLRSSFGSSKGRIPFWSEYPPRHVWQLAQRPSFTGSGTDNADYSVFWWDQDWEGSTTMTLGWDWKNQEIA